MKLTQQQAAGIRSKVIGIELDNKTVKFHCTDNSAGLKVRGIITTAYHPLSVRAMGEGSVFSGWNVFWVIFTSRDAALECYNDTVSALNGGGSGSSGGSGGSGSGGGGGLFGLGPQPSSGSTDDPPASGSTNDPPLNHGSGGGGNGGYQHPTHQSSGTTVTTDTHTAAFDDTTIVVVGAAAIIIVLLLDI